MATRSRSISLFAGLAVFSFSARPGAVAAEGAVRQPARIRYESADDWNRCARDQFIWTQPTQSSVRLVRSWLVATESGVTSKHRQTLSDTCWIKKVFPGVKGRTAGAELWMFDRSGTTNDPVVILFNGHKILHTTSNVTDARGWAVEPIPADWIKAQANEVILSGNGSVPLDIYSANAGSAISYDAGRTWHPANGEYSIRLRVQSYAPRGVLTSDIIDSGAVLEPGRAFGPWLKLERATIEADADTPAGTSLTFQWRAGHTRFFKPDQWTPWQDGVSLAAHGRRFIQWRAQLSTSTGARTPLVRKITVTLTPATGDPAPLPPAVRITRHDQPADLAGSHAFTYETDTPKIRYLRDKYNLPAVVPPTGSDLAATTAIRYWVSHQWKQGWDWGKYQFVPAWDALTLLEMAPPNYCLGMCTHYATVYVQASAALGFISRHLILDSHCLAETHLDDAGQWIVQDPGPGPGPSGYPTGVIYVTNGVALNALDMHRILASTEDSVQAVPRAGDGNAMPYGKKDKLWLYKRFGIPLRNNHLSVPAPAEEEHGQDHYHWNGYLWWTDDLDSPQENVRCFSLLSNRPADFYPGVNSTWIDMESTNPRVLRLSFSNNMPNWKTYEVQVDGGDWQPAGAVFDWTLHAGNNRLAARSRSLFGRAGRASSVEAEVTAEQKAPVP